MAEEGFVPGEAGYDWDALSYNRIAVLNALASRVPDCRYLEIGCAGNECFLSVMAPHKVGVDPERGGTVRATSDDFFAGNDATFDLVFVDGLHTYEQVHRDAENALARVPVGGFVVFHDMLPNNAMEAAPRPVIPAWTGDVWRLGFELARLRGTTYRTIEIDHGVGVLRKDHPDATLPPALAPDLGFEVYLRQRTAMNLTDFEGFRETFLGRRGLFRR